MRSDYEFVPAVALVRKDVKTHPQTLAILERLSSYAVDVHEVADDAEAIETLKNLRKKKHVYLTRNELKFVREKNFGKDCTSGARHYCLDHISGCDFACIYCYLHTYLKDDPLLRLHVNTEDLFEELDAVAGAGEEPLFISTGELSDSLLFDWIAQFVPQAFSFLKTRPQITMEFRSKSRYCGFLDQIEPLDNMFFTWTVSPEPVVKNYELKTASLQDRVACLKLSQQHGFKPGLIIDPMLHFEGWQEAYAEMLAYLAQELDLKSIERTFVGSFRYMKGMDQDILKKFPKTDLFLEEFVLARDGKYRYFKPLRKQMYAFMKQQLDLHQGRMSLSMEFPETWERILG